MNHPPLLRTFGLTVTLAVVLALPPAAVAEGPANEVPVGDEDEDEALLVPEDDNALIPLVPVDTGVGGYRLKSDVVISHERERILRTGGSRGDLDEAALERLELDNPAEVLRSLLVPRMPMFGRRP